MSQLGVAKIDTVIWQPAPIPESVFDAPLIVIPVGSDWPPLLTGHVHKQFPSDRPAFLPACSDEEMSLDDVAWWARAPKGPVYLQEVPR